MMNTLMKLYVAGECKIQGIEGLLNARNGFIV